MNLKLTKRLVFNIYSKNRGLVIQMEKRGYTSRVEAQIVAAIEEQYPEMKEEYDRLKAVVHEVYTKKVPQEAFSKELKRHYKWFGKELEHHEQWLEK